MENNTLVHYGIKGMKWGVRRTEAQLARARGERWNPLKRSAKKSVTKKTSSSTEGKKKVSEMSDDELRKAVNRLQLEKQYKQLNQKSLSLGQKFANKVIKDVVTPAVTQASQNALRNYIEKELNKQLSKSK